MQTRGSSCGDKPRGLTRDHGKTGPAASTWLRPKVKSDMGGSHRQWQEPAETRGCGVFPKRMWRRKRVHRWADGPATEDGRYGHVSQVNDTGGKWRTVSFHSAFCLFVFCHILQLPGGAWNKSSHRPPRYPLSMDSRGLDFVCH